MRKNIFKHFGFIIVTAVIGFTMTACVGGSGNAAKDIVGTWETEIMGVTTTLVLNADKTGSMESFGSTSDIFWEVYTDKVNNVTYTYVFADKEPLPDKFEVTMLHRPHYLYDAKEGTLSTGAGFFKKVK